MLHDVTRTPWNQNSLLQAAAVNPQKENNIKRLVGIEFSSDKNNLFHKTLGWKGRRMHHKKLWWAKKKKRIKVKETKRKLATDKKRTLEKKNKQNWREKVKN